MFRVSCQSQRNEYERLWLYFSGGGELWIAYSNIRRRDLYGLSISCALEYVKCPCHIGFNLVKYNVRRWGWKTVRLSARETFEQISIPSTDYHYWTFVAFHLRATRYQPLLDFLHWNNLIRDYRGVFCFSEKNRLSTVWLMALDCRSSSSRSFRSIYILEI